MYQNLEVSMIFCVHLISYVVRKLTMKMTKLEGFLESLRFDLFFILVSKYLSSKKSQFSRLLSSNLCDFAIALLEFARISVNI